MLPELARRVITTYSEPGDLVVDPMCGIGTTLVEAIHLDRNALGVELERRWASLATANLTHAREQGAPGRAAVLEGDEAIEVVRALNGATDGRKAAPGTIRGDLSLSNSENLVHGSDSAESAEREIKIWFPELG